MMIFPHRCFGVRVVYVGIVERVVRGERSPALLLSHEEEGKMALMKSIGSNDSDENGSPPPFCPPLSRC